MEYKHGSHSIYDDLKYHVVFCTKYRYRILTGQVGLRARELIREMVGNVNEQDIQEYIENQELHHKEDNFKISDY